MANEIACIHKGIQLHIVLDAKSRQQVYDILGRHIACSEWMLQDRPQQLYCQLICYQDDVSAGGQQLFAIT
jgi:hypothetical protein